MWPAIFAKAFGLVSMEEAELRRAYVKFPWPHFYELPHAVAGIAVERRDAGDGLFMARIVQPGALALTELDQQIRSAASLPVDRIKDFRRTLQIASLPRPIRRTLWWIGLNVGRQRGNYFGTFVISTVSRHGGELQNLITPVSLNLTYGALSPDGELDVRLIFDHRVMDGRAAARALVRLEEILLGPVTDELVASSVPP
jgi:hypothetical protein